MTSVDGGILIAPTSLGNGGSTIRRVVSSGQVVIPRTLLADHGIEDDGRVYVGVTTYQPASLIVVPESRVKDPFFAKWSILTKGARVVS